LPPPTQQNSTLASPCFPAPSVHEPTALPSVPPPYGQTNAATASDSTLSSSLPEQPASWLNQPSFMEPLSSFHQVLLLRSNPQSQS
jgi:hypothetical protein